jgi:YVTN family beta-propeller protein
MKTLKNLLLVTMIISAISISCSKEDEQPFDTGYLHGVFITNEGGFLNNNGSISYYDIDSGKVTNNLFKIINGYGLGDIVQSFGIAGDKGFIVVNNSQKVEVVDMESFESLGTIIGVDYPRYFLGIDNDKGYLTNGSYAGKVYIIDLVTLDLIDSVAVGNGPENIVKSGNYVYVANSGGWTSDSTVSVIDITTDQVIETIIVGDNPTDLVIDKIGDIWVLCKGKVVYGQSWNIVDETGSKLVQINGDSRDVEKTFTIGQTGDFYNPKRLAIGKDGENIYFDEAGGIYKMKITDSDVPSSAYIPRQYYGLDIDPDEGTIFCLKANGFDANGMVYIYNSNGILTDTLEVGIAPNGATLN